MCAEGRIIIKKDKDMAKATAMKGGNLMVWIPVTTDETTVDTVIPLSTSCKIDQTTEVVDPETKDDSIYQEIDPEGDKWTVQCDAQLTFNMDVYEMLHAAYNNHTAVALKIGVPTNKSDEGLPAAGWTAPSTNYFYGHAYITSLGSQGDKGSKATCSVTFTGCDALSLV